MARLAGVPVSARDGAGQRDVGVRHAGRGRRRRRRRRPAKHRGLQHAPPAHRARRRQLDRSGAVPQRHGGEATPASGRRLGDPAVRPAGRDRSPPGQGSDRARRPLLPGDQLSRSLAPLLARVGARLSASHRHRGPARRRQVAGGADAVPAAEAAGAASSLLHSDPGLRLGRGRRRSPRRPLPHDHPDLDQAPRPQKGGAARHRGGGRLGARRRAVVEERVPGRDQARPDGAPRGSRSRCRGESTGAASGRCERHSPGAGPR